MKKKNVAHPVKLHLGKILELKEGGGVIIESGTKRKFPFNTGSCREVVVEEHHITLGTEPSVPEVLYKGLKVVFTTSKNQTADAFALSSQFAAVQKTTTMVAITKIKIGRGKWRRKPAWIGEHQLRNFNSKTRSLTKVRRIVVGNRHFAQAA